MPKDLRIEPIKLYIMPLGVRIFVRDNRWGIYPWQASQQFERNNEVT